ncbi:MAG: homoserine O-succinyltransferase, partial [Kiloniellales bacterium]|nr:homoserine O-succinyltransferase [Kiloniellales bacterium]
ALYMFDHLEYEADTLAREYLRDLKAGGPVCLPRHYFPADDPAQAPVNGWGAYGRLLFGNWLDEIRRELSGRTAAAADGLWAQLAERWRTAGLGAPLCEFR